MKKKKKRLLVDLYYLKDPYRGYGQIALNYGYYFKENYHIDTSPYELYLLVPKKYIGHFGNEVKYLSTNNWFTWHYNWLLPKFDLWHNLQYPSRFKPSRKETKYIFTLHDLNCLDNQYEKRDRRVNRNYRKISQNINRADIVVAVSQYAFNQIKEVFNVSDEKLNLIYNGVEKLTDKPLSKPDVDIRQPFFFYISAYRAKKNFHVLLDLMKLMPDKNLYLAGNDDTSYGNKIKKRIQDENITNVYMLGKISEEEKRWMYANCQALLFPSEFEGFGLPLIEAMQFGKPVFSSKATSLPEVGGKHAYFWDNFNPEHMKSVIDNNLENFYSNPHFAEAAKKYADTFSYKKYFEEYEKIYREIV